MKKTEANTPPKSADVSRHWREVLHDERITHVIKDAFRCTSSALQRRLRKHSVLYGHWTFLRILWQTDGVTQRQLSEQAGVTEPSTFSALQAMEKLGYITRQKMPDNKKQIRVFLTSKGTALRSQIVPAAEEINRIALAGIPPEDIAVTRRTLLALVENLAGDAANLDLAAASVAGSAAEASDADEDEGTEAAA
ncbi:MAG: MarR family transcriptional regulator [Nitrosomonadaceae bacterium]|nr:MarR family transcriptional regulator [Nitrosomonadaceae bacterium]